MEGVSLEHREAYGLVNFTTVPHWGTEDFKEKYLGGRIATVYREDQVPLILLTDDQYVHIRNGTMEIIDVKTVS